MKTGRDRKEARNGRAVPGEVGFGSLSFSGVASAVKTAALETKQRVPREHADVAVCDLLTWGVLFFLIGSLGTVR